MTMSPADDLLQKQQKQQNHKNSERAGSREAAAWGERCG
jgi:hypothetical protein